MSSISNHFDDPNRIISLPSHETDTECRVIGPDRKSILNECRAMGQSVDWGHGLLNIKECWSKFECTGKGVRVAVLDTGIDSSHPDLEVAEGRDFTNSRYGWKDSQGHGSHCSGIIAARNNSIGLVGAAPDAILLAGKVLSDNGSGTIQGIVDGIEWAIARKADVISMSLGGDGPISGIMKNAIDKAIRSGVLVIVAAGNSGPYENSVGSPGNYNLCVSVGAVDSNARVAEFSSRGNQVDIVAPGVRIMSTYPNGKYTALSGTSMATPYVAAIAAMYVELCRKVRVNPEQRAFERLLTDTARDLGVRGKDTSYGFGLAQPYHLLSKLVADNAPPPPPPPPTPSPPSPRPTPPSPEPEEPENGHTECKSIRVNLTDGKYVVLENVESIVFL